MLEDIKMNYHIFDQQVYSGLRIQAEASPRKRAHLNIHHSYDEAVQKVLICMLYGTYIPPHCHIHKHQSELFIVLHGSIKLIIFDENGKVLKKISLGDGSNASIVEIEPKLIHTVICESDEAFVLEVKEGPFVQEESKVFPEWSIQENDTQAKAYLEELYIMG